MRVEMRIEMSGTRNGEPWPHCGCTIDVPDAEGAALCAAGSAVPVVVSDKRTAAAPRAERRKG